jgi:energy-coupling factor transporter transmembrane protein EcfT
MEMNQHAMQTRGFSEPMRQPEEMPDEPKKTKWWLWLIIVLLVLGIGAGLYYLFFLGR